MPRDFGAFACSNVVDVELVSHLDLRDLHLVSDFFHLVLGFLLGNALLFLCQLLIGSLRGSLHLLLLRALLCLDQLALG